MGTTDVIKDDPSNVIITDEIARKLFGEESPLGRQITVRIDAERQADFRVAAVVAEPPINSSLLLGVCINYEKQRDIYGYELENWSDWTSSAFVQLNDGTNRAAVERQMQEYLTNANEANPNSLRDGFFLRPLRELPALTREIGGPFRPGMHPAAIMAPTVAAFLVLLLACFNFMNTSIAFASRRVREIGVRKVIGGMRGQLIGQFMGESLLLCFLALIVGAALAEIFVPAYDSLWPELDLTLTYAANLGLVAFLVGLLLFTGVAAGAYPAFYIARFRPVSIFRGRQKLSGTGALVKVLLTLQLCLAMSCIVMALILTRNAEYMRVVDCGYDVHNTYVVPISGESEYEVLEAAIKDHPDVLAVGATRHVMARSWAFDRVEIEQAEALVNYFEIGRNYFETIGFRLSQGRSFDADLSTDLTEAVMVNRTLVEAYHWEAPLDQRIVFRDGDETEECRVIGVVENFYPNTVSTRLRPTVLRLASPDRCRYAVVRLNPDKREEVTSYIEGMWKRNFPHLAFQGFWADSSLQGEIRTNRSIQLVCFYVGAMVVIISAMGLVALVSLNIARRTREMGIRKALGASTIHIGNLIAREFVILILVGGVLAAGLGYFLSDSLLGSIWSYYCDFGIMPFVLSVILVLAVAALAVGYRVAAAARANPVEALRYE